jgi:hypothetical protein
LESGFWQVLFRDRRLPDLDAEEPSHTVRQRFPGIEVVLLDPELNPALGPVLGPVLDPTNDAESIAAEEKEGPPSRPECERPATAAPYSVRLNNGTANASVTSAKIDR